MKEEIKAIVKYRLEQAEEALKDATLLFNSRGSFRSVINRSYYTMFYAILALIVVTCLGGIMPTSRLTVSLSGPGIDFFENNRMLERIVIG